MPDSPFNKVLWNHNKMEARAANQALAFNLTRHLLNEYPKGDMKGLLKKYREITKDEEAEMPAQLVK